MKKKLLFLIALSLSLNSFAQLPSWLSPNGLLAWYPFNGNANDISGQGNNGTVTNASLTTDMAGNANAAYAFDGVSGNIHVLDNAALRLNGTDFTISAWVYETALDTGNLDAILSKRLTVSTSGYIFGIAGAASAASGKVLFQLSGGVNPKALSTSAITLNAWQNIIITYNHTSLAMKIYLNGALNASIPNMPSPNATAWANLWIGNDVSGSDYCFHGKLDDIPFIIVC